MRNEKGFTVLEIITVMVIGGIMVGIAAHSIATNLPGKHLSGAAMMIRSDLNNAKMQALRDGVQYQVSVNGNNYTLKRGDLSSGTDFTDTSLPTTIKDLPYSDVALSGGPFVFDPRGTASQTANIVLTNDKGDTRTISVTLAGRIRSSL